MSAAQPMPFCATCLTETWDLIPGPWGRDGRLVRICHACHSPKAKGARHRAELSGNQNARHQRDRRKRLRDQGLCINCGRVACAQGSACCAGCLEANRTRRLAAERKAREERAGKVLR